MPMYAGKSMDAFEDVWNMWMRSVGAGDLICADVMSFRCFAFSFGEDITRWFSPAQPIHGALEELCSSLGIRETCSIIQASVWEMQEWNTERPVLLADVHLGVEIPTVREQFYRGAPPFCLLYGCGDGKHLVYASSGVPFIKLTEEQVREKISCSKGYVLAGRMPVRIRQMPAREILHRGLRWRKNILDRQAGTNLLCSGIFKREWNRASCLSIQYGLMNCQIQLSKMVKFCVQEMQVSDSAAEELNKVLLKISSLRISGCYEELVEIDRDFWALIETIEESICLMQNGSRRS